MSYTLTVHFRYYEGEDAPLTFHSKKSLAEMRMDGDMDGPFLIFFEGADEVAYAAKDILQIESALQEEEDNDE